MKLWEVIKELTDDPTKRFERKERFKHWVMGTDVVGGAIRGSTYYFMLDCDGEDSYGDAGEFSGNFANNEDDWQLVRQPVTWQEAIQAWADGKKVVWEEDTDRRVFDRNKGWLSTKHQAQMIDQDGDAVSVRMISGGAWYMED